MYSHLVSCFSLSLGEIIVSSFSFLLDENIIPVLTFVNLLPGKFLFFDLKLPLFFPISLEEHFISQH